ncbi:hypothetical protein PV773_06095 [Mesorhizobium sp. CC13]|uniref:hypothetical protein n=1 Tax=Mesorhizobium sp. CC13 TaxID=3029194 RepID=UPI003264CFF3
MILCKAFYQRLEKGGRPCDSLALLVRPEVLALDVDDIATVQAFHLGVRTNPADACLGLMMATGALHIDFEVVSLALCHGNSETIPGRLSFRQQRAPALLPAPWMKVSPLPLSRHQANVRRN